LDQDGDPDDEAQKPLRVLAERRGVMNFRVKRRPRPAPAVRSAFDRGITALILGFFAAMWFSWGQADASPGLSTALSVGAVGALAVAVVAAFRAFRHRRGDRALQDPGAKRRYGLVVGVEFGLAGLGALGMGVIGAGAYIPVWICAVVGLHFFPLATLFGARALDTLGVVVTAVAAVALFVGLLTDIAPGNVSGAGAGLAMLFFAVLALGEQTHAEAPA